MTVTLDIILVNWNAGDQLRACLASIGSAAKDNFTLQRVVVVDNASFDDSLVGLDTLPLPLQIIRNAANQGFARGCNQGAAGSTADYLLFLNCDTRLFTHSLTGVIDFMEQPDNATIGICGICLVNEAGQPGTAAARFPTLRVMFGKMTGLSTLLPALFPSHLMRPAEMRSNREVDQVMGAFFLIRKPVYDQCGGFDEQFYVYFEEVDLAWRAKALGHRSYYLANVQAFHVGGGLSQRVKARRLFYSLRSRLYYAQKHYRPWPRRLLTLSTFTVEPAVRLLRALFLLSPQQVRETLAGYRLLLRHCLITHDLRSP
jgi:GT2 family glycosyltransferase